MDKNRWRDTITLGPRRRRRLMTRQLAELQHLDDVAMMRQLEELDHLDTETMMAQLAELAELEHLDAVTLTRQLPEPERPDADTVARHRGGRRAPGRARAGASLTLTTILVVAVLATVGWAKAPLPVVRAIQTVGSQRPPIPADVQRTRLGSPPASPTGSGGYAFTARQPSDPRSPVTYDPCRPIHVVVNSDGAPPHASRLLDDAIAEVSRVTGLRFVIDGGTDEEPRASRPPLDEKRYGDRWSPVLIAWTTPSVIPALAGDVVGLGGSVGYPGADGQSPRWVSGVVYLDAPWITESLQQGPQGFAESRGVLMHELGHLLGLDHVLDREQLMVVRDHVGPPTFGPGDLRGLRLLGLGPCHFDT